MKALVDNIVHVVTKGDGLSGFPSRTKRELQILQRIVNASVAALK
jgi:hypothetical protein